VTLEGARVVSSRQEPVRSWTCRADEGIRLEAWDTFAAIRRAKGEKSNQAIGPVLEAVTPTTITSLLLLAAGIVLVLGVHAGLYVLVGPVFVALVGGITSAWLFLTQITE
jgi:hypothetical protein